MFKRKGKLKKEFDEQLHQLLLSTKEEWEHAREMERYINDYDEAIIVQRKMAEAKHFYLFKEAKIRKLGIN